MIDGRIIGSDGSAAKVTASGELVVGPLHYNDTFFVDLDANDVPKNLIAPLPGKQFVIHSIGGRAGFSVGNAATATLIVYEASDKETSTVDKILHKDFLLREGVIAIAGINVLVNPGKWVNAVTDDSGISLTIWGYYIDELT